MKQHDRFEKGKPYLVTKSEDPRYGELYNMFMSRFQNRVEGRYPPSSEPERLKLVGPQEQSPGICGDGLTIPRRKYLERWTHLLYGVRPCKCGAVSGCMCEPPEDK